MKVSVIMCNYNNAQYIDRAVTSVLTQKINFNIEVLFCDDGSKDNSVEVFREFLPLSTPKLKLIPLFQKHSGLMENYKNGFSNCKGKYIAMLDTDDYWIDKLKLKKQVEYMDNHLDCGLCVTKVFTKKENIITGIPDADFINKQLTFDNLLIGNAYIHAQSYCIRKSTFDKYIDFSKFMRFYTWDYPIVLELIRHTKFHCLDFYSAVFVKNTESVTQTKNRTKRFKNIYGQYKIKLYYILKYGCKFSTILWLIYYLARRIYSLIFKTW